MTPGPPAAVAQFVQVSAQETGRAGKGGTASSTMVS